jgi:hypothetical protein
MSTEQQDKDAERKQWDLNQQRLAQKRLHREGVVRRLKDIVWSAVIGSVITIIVVTSLGWLTTQSVVEAARQQGRDELVALTTSICTARFQQRQDAAARLGEFKALQYGEKDDAIRKLVSDSKLATMQGESAPAAGAVNKCADAISGLSRG